MQYGGPPAAAECTTPTIDTTVMRKLRIGVVDLVAKSPSTAWWARVMRANLASIMPQAIGAWCARDGHEVGVAYYSGSQPLAGHLPESPHVVFIGAFTQSALLAYALSAQFRSGGAVTVLGGPHATSYPEDARAHFDYVVTSVDRTLLREILREREPHRLRGDRRQAARQLDTVPGVRERWPFLAPLLARAPIVKFVPMLSSLGCPYSCGFCVDAAEPYKPLDTREIVEDLRFLRRTMRRPRVGWHDPNFGVRFPAVMDAIEEAVPPGTVDFVAESTLSVLTEPNLVRLRRNGFKALAPGIEGWFEFGEKSHTGRSVGAAKMRDLADHANLIMRYVPYLQTNFVFGLDSDTGAEPFELTKEFLTRAPGAFPAYSLLTAFGGSAPQNRSYHQEGRLLGVPFHFLNNCHAMNVRPRHYEWSRFYEHVIDLSEHSFSRSAITKRLRVNGLGVGWINVLRGLSSEGAGRTEYFRRFRRAFDEPGFRRFFEQDTGELPTRLVNPIRHDLGPLWDRLPPSSLCPSETDFA